MGRVAALVVLLVLGVVSLPAVAGVLDGQGTENWVVPVQLALMAGIGALIGLGAALHGLVIFFLLLSGISGA